MKNNDEHPDTIVEQLGLMKRLKMKKRIQQPLIVIKVTMKIEMTTEETGDNEDKVNAKIK